jgi:FtsP/CotA-like multicopper oxidase with cupredoxin domain
VIAFEADNPGIWMDHCHNLPHAQEGLVAHLMYEGVTTRFRLGRDTPNSPE